MRDLLRTAAKRPSIVFAVVSVVYVSTGTYGGNDSRDTLTASAASWVLATRHTLNMAFLKMAQMHPSYLWVVPGAHGAIVSNRFPGAVISALPLYALTSRSAYSPVPATLTAAFTAAAAAAVLFAILRRVQPLAVAWAGAAAFAFATSNWTVSGRELWQHAGSELLIATGMLMLYQRKWALSGLALGGTILFRPHLGVAVAIVAIGILLTDRKWSSAASFTVSSAPGVAGLLLWNWFAYGRLTVTGGYKDVTAVGVGPYDFLLNVLGTFFSPERGLLVCSPVLLLAVLGIRQGWKSSPIAFRLSALAGVGYLVSQLWLIRFSGGDGFVGYRTCLESLVFAAPVLVDACAIGAKRAGTYVAWMLVAASVAFYSAGAFVQGETTAVNANPWTNWAPLQLTAIYGYRSVILGAVIGLGAVLVVFAVVERQGAEASVGKSTAGPTSSPASVDVLSLRVRP